MTQNKPNVLAVTFEKILAWSRLVVLLAVVGLLISSVVMILRGLKYIWYGVASFVHDSIPAVLEAYAGKDVLLTFIKAVDNFLIALVLLIFCLGIYELFVSKIDPLHKKNDDFNYWFRVSSLEDLKKYFGKVVLMILIVNFFEKSAQFQYTAPVDLLYLGGGVLMIAVSLFLTHENHKPVPEVVVEKQ